VVSQSVACSVSTRQTRDDLISLTRDQNVVFLLIASIVSLLWCGVCECGRESNIAIAVYFAVFFIVGMDEQDFTHR
jgi:hypothetical protein